MKIIGITGGSGAGKSVVSVIWEEMGARVIDADRVYHRLLRESRPLCEELFARFPDAEREGGVDRAALRSVVFSDESALRDLNAITHKYVLEEIHRLLDAAREERAGLVALEALYLLENELADACGVIVGVVADEEVRARRIAGRDGLDESAARSRLASQKDSGYYRSRCDVIIENSGSPEDLAAEARRVYLSLSK